MAKARICRSIRVGLGPTAQRRLQQGGVLKEAVDRDVRDNVLIERYKAAFECLLDAYRLRNKISEDEHRVGIKFRHAYMRSVLKIMVDDIGSGCRGSYDMAALLPIHSERVLREACSALSPSQQAVVIAVCGHDERPRDKDHFQTLRRGLEILVKLWDTPGDIGYK